VSEATIAGAAERDLAPHTAVQASRWQGLRGRVALHADHLGTAKRQDDLVKRYSSWSCMTRVPAFDAPVQASWGDWDEVPPQYRNERVDPPTGHKDEFAVLYTADTLGTVRWNVGS
jgi:hypothetical protein